MLLLRLRLMIRMTNDEKIKIMKKRRILYYLIIFFGLATLVLAIFSLVEKFTPIPAIITFAVEAILSNYRNKLSYDSKEEAPGSKNQG